MRQEARLSPRGRMQEQGFRGQGPGTAPNRARSNGLCEARRHKDFGKEVKLVMCNKEM